MRAIINNIMNSYRMQAETLSVLLNHTQRALEQAENKKKADEQVQRVESFVRNLIMHLNNLLERFYLLKQRRDGRQERITDAQQKAMTELGAFIRSCALSLSSLLRRSEETQTFEEKIDEQMRELEAGIGGKLQELDEVLGESIPSLTLRLVRLTKNMTGGLAKFLKIPSVASTATSRRIPDKPVNELARDTIEDSPTPAQDVYSNGL